LTRLLEEARRSRLLTPRREVVNRLRVGLGVQPAGRIGVHVRLKLCHRGLPHVVRPLGFSEPSLDPVLELLGKLGGLGLHRPSAGRRGALGGTRRIHALATTAGVDVACTEGRQEHAHRERLGEPFGDRLLGINPLADEVRDGLSDGLLGALCERVARDHRRLPDRLGHGRPEPAGERGPELGRCTLQHAAHAAEDPATDVARDRFGRADAERGERFVEPGDVVALVAERGHLAALTASTLRAVERRHATRPSASHRRHLHSLGREVAGVDGVDRIVVSLARSVLLVGGLAEPVGRLRGCEPEDVEPGVREVAGEGSRRILNTTAQSVASIVGLALPGLLVEVLARNVTTAGHPLVDVLDRELSVGVEVVLALGLPPLVLLTDVECRPDARVTWSNPGVA